MTKMMLVKEIMTLLKLNCHLQAAGTVMQYTINCCAAYGTVVITESPAEPENESIRVMCDYFITESWDVMRVTKLLAHIESAVRTSKSVTIVV